MNKKKTNTASHLVLPGLESTVACCTNGTRVWRSNMVTFSPFGLSSMFFCFSPSLIGSRNPGPPIPGREQRLHSFPGSACNRGLCFKPPDFLLHCDACMCVYSLALQVKDPVLQRQLHKLKLHGRRLGAKSPPEKNKKKKLRCSVCHFVTLHYC